VRVEPFLAQPDLTLSAADALLAGQEAVAVGPAGMDSAFIPPRRSTTT
jgi:hypothetical protein